MPWAGTKCARRSRVLAQLRRRGRHGEQLECSRVGGHEHARHRRSGRGTAGVGGGIAILGTATIDDTTITGNTASTTDNDVDGTFGS